MVDEADRPPKGPSLIDVVVMTPAGVANMGDIPASNTRISGQFAVHVCRIGLQVLDDQMWLPEDMRIDALQYKFIIFPLACGNQVCIVDITIPVVAQFCDRLPV